MTEINGVEVVCPHCETRFRISGNDHSRIITCDLKLKCSICLFVFTIYEVVFDVADSNLSSFSNLQEAEETDHFQEGYEEDDNCTECVHEDEEDEIRHDNHRSSLSKEDLVQYLEYTFSECSEYSINDSLAETTSDYYQNNNENHWEFLGRHLKEYEEFPSKDAIAVVETDGRLSKEEVCLKQAIEICDRYDWDEEGVQLLKDIFVAYNIPFTKPAIVKELESGLRYDELRLACELRMIWHQHPEFSMGSLPFLNNRDRSYAWALSENLNWHSALTIVRQFMSYPSPAEIERALICLFEGWTNSLALRKTFLMFIDYLLHRIEIGEINIDLFPYLETQEDLK